MHRKRSVFSSVELNSMVTDNNSCVALKSVSKHIPLHPYYLNNIKEGLHASLNKKLKKYDNQLGGLILGYCDIKVEIGAARSCGRNGLLEFPLRFQCYVFQPFVGCTLKGVVNQISPDHIGCIVHKYFNASIPRPEEESYEHWSKRQVNFNDVIKFRVKDLDFSGAIPYIEGALDLTELNDDDPQSDGTEEEALMRENEQLAMRELFDQRKNFLSSNSGCMSEEPDEFPIVSSTIIHSEADSSNASVSKLEEVSPSKKNKKKIINLSKKQSNSAFNDSDINRMSPIPKTVYSLGKNLNSAETKLQFSSTPRDGDSPKKKKSASSLNATNEEQFIKPLPKKVVSISPIRKSDGESPRAIKIVEASPAQEVPGDSSSTHCGQKSNLKRKKKKKSDKSDVILSTRNNLPPSPEIGDYQLHSKDLNLEFTSSYQDDDSSDFDRKKSTKRRKEIRKANCITQPSKQQKMVSIIPKVGECQSIKTNSKVPEFQTSAISNLINHAEKNSKQSPKKANLSIEAQSEVDSQRLKEYSETTYSVASSSLCTDDLKYIEGMSTQARQTFEKANKAQANMMSCPETGEFQPGTRDSKVNSTGSCHDDSNFKKKSKKKRKELDEVECNDKKESEMKDRQSVRQDSNVPDLQSFRSDSTKEIMSPKSKQKLDKRNKKTVDNNHLNEYSRVIESVACPATFTENIEVGDSNPASRISNLDSKSSHRVDDSPNLKRKKTRKELGGDKVIAQSSVKSLNIGDGSSIKRYPSLLEHKSIPSIPELINSKEKTENSQKELNVTKEALEKGSSELTEKQSLDKLSRTIESVASSTVCTDDMEYINAMPTPARKAFEEQRRTYSLIQSLNTPDTHNRCDSATPESDSMKSAGVALKRSRKKLRKISEGIEESEETHMLAAHSPKKSYIPSCKGSGTAANEDELQCRNAWLASPHRKPKKSHKIKQETANTFTAEKIITHGVATENVEGKEFQGDYRKEAKPKKDQNSLNDPTEAEELRVRILEEAKKQIAGPAFAQPTSGKSNRKRRSSESSSGSSKKRRKLGSESLEAKMEYHKRKLEKLALRMQQSSTAK